MEFTITGLDLVVFIGGIFSGMLGCRYFILKNNKKVNLDKNDVNNINLGKDNTIKNNVKIK